MKIPIPPALQPTNEMLTLIAAIDEFKGEWRALGNLGPETLRTLRRIATIESAGSSTRIEGAKLSDGEVEQLVGRLGKESFQSRDEQEVAGYAYDPLNPMYFHLDRRPCLESEEVAPWLTRETIRASFQHEPNYTRARSLVGLVAASLVGFAISFGSLSIAEESNADSSKDGNARQVNTSHPLMLPHLQQRSGTNYCGPTCVLIAYQRQTGLRLDNPILPPRFASMVMERAGRPDFGLSPGDLFKPLNIEFEQTDYAEAKKLTDIKATRTLALSILREEILPKIQRGALFQFQVTSGLPLGHSVLIASYDSGKKKLIEHDPLIRNSTEITIEQLADKWPYRDPKEGRYILRTRSLTMPARSELRDPPANACLDISAKALEDLKIPEVLTPQMLDWAEGTTRLAENTEWRHLSKWWDNRNPRDVLGVADVVRIKVAQGEPPLMLFKQGNGIRVVVVSGYRGGYCNPKGKIQLTFIHEGKMLSGWLGVGDFLEKCSPRQGDGRYGCYIGYPAESLKNPEQNLDSIAEASRFTDEVDITRLINNSLIIEGETLVGSAKVSGGIVEAQGLPGVCSAGAQLWWKDTAVGNSLKLLVNTSDLPSGTCDLSLYPTCARDYAKVSIEIQGQKKEVDLYRPDLTPGSPLLFQKLTIEPKTPLEVTVSITGKHDQAIPNYMFGLDRMKFIATSSRGAKPGAEQEKSVAQEITLIKAHYGSREQFAAGDPKDVTERAREYLVDGKLHIPHTRQAFGDPHPYKGKIFRMTYLLDGENAADGQPHVFENKAGEITFDPLNLSTK